MELTKTIESEIINNWLKTQVKVPLTNKPMFQLILSEDATEMRMGTFRTFVAGVFVKEEKKVELVPKYSWINERWILEQWYPPELVNTEELVNSNEGSYEPIYVFENGKTRVPLPLNLQVVQFIVNRIVGKKRESDKVIQSILAANITKKDEEEIAYFEDALEVSTDISSNLHFGEGIIVPHNYPVTSPNLKGK